MQVISSKPPTHIWYAAFGSNMCAARFSCYIQGGTIAGNNRVYPPCPDPTPPRESRRLELPFELYFGGESPAWGGGVAFLRRTQGAQAVSRAYLITLSQFEHVVAQENRLDTLPNLPIRDAMHDGSANIARSANRYDELLFCGTELGYPVFSFTSASQQPVNRPAEAYLETIIRGLRELGLQSEEISRYLSATPGVKDQFTPSELRQLLKQPSLFGKALKYRSMLTDWLPGSK